MEKKVFAELVEKMTLHFHSEKSKFTGHGHPKQEPYKTDLLKIFVKAFQNRNKEDEYDIAWDRFNDKLFKEVKKTRSHISDEEISRIFNLTSSMWDEWLYIFDKIRADYIGIAYAHNKHFIVFDSSTDEA